MTIEQLANYFIKMGLLTPKEAQYFLFTMFLPKDFVQRIRELEDEI